MGTRSRSFCALTGALLAIAGLALVPLYARSAGQIRPLPSIDALSEHLSAPALGKADLPAISDPFVRPIVEPVPASHLGHPGLTRSPSIPRDAPTVRAIVTGGEPRALLENGAVTLIVGIGDRVGEATVRAITDDAVSLDDGRHLRLEVVR